MPLGLEWPSGGGPRSAAAPGGGAGQVHPLCPGSRVPGPASDLKAPRGEAALTEVDHERPELHPLAKVDRHREFLPEPVFQVLPNDAGRYSRAAVDLFASAAADAVTSPCTASAGTVTFPLARERTSVAARPSRLEPPVTSTSGTIFRWPSATALAIATSAVGVSPMAAR